MLYVFFFLSFLFSLLFLFSLSLSLSHELKIYGSKSIGVDFHKAEKSNADATCKAAIG